MLEQFRTWLTITSIIFFGFVFITGSIVFVSTHFPTALPLFVLFLLAAMIGLLATMFSD